MRDVLKDLAYQLWPGDTVGDGAVGVDASVFGNVSVGEAREAVVLYNADPPVGAPKLLVHSFGNYDSIINDVALSHCEHAVDWQEPVGVDAHPVR